MENIKRNAAGQQFDNCCLDDMIQEGSICCVKVVMSIKDDGR